MIDQVYRSRGKKCAPILRIGRGLEAFATLHGQWFLEASPYEPPTDQAPEIARIKRLLSSCFGLMSPSGLLVVPANEVEAGKLPGDEL